MAEATTTARTTLHLLYFAWLRERVGTAEERIELPAGVATVGALIAWLQARGPGHAAAFAVANRVRCAVNQEFAGPDAAVRPGDEVAFFPPVTGG
jgi:sulfur-carrier protein